MFIGSAHDVDEVSSGCVARKISKFWSLSTPCVRTEDLCGLITVASVLGRDAGYSRRILGGFVSSPGSRILPKFLKVVGAFRGAAGFFRLGCILGWCCCRCFDGIVFVLLFEILFEAINDWLGCVAFG
jgi:hypothetical protein